MILEQRYDYVGAKLHNSLATVVLPIQKIVNWPTQFKDFLSTNLASHKKLLADNAALQQQNFVLQLQLQQLNLLQEENNQLRAYLKSPPHINAARTMIAQILNINSDTSNREFVIDKGANSAVTTGLAAVDAQGVIGQIIQVDPYTSRIMLITDIRSNVPVENARTQARSIVAGTGDPNYLILLNTGATTDIKEGDLIRASGLGGRYPAGYPVGVVSNIIRKPGEQFLVVKIKPSAALNRGREILLVWLTSEDKPVTINETNTNTTNTVKNKLHKDSSVDSKKAEKANNASNVSR